MDPERGCTDTEAETLRRWILQYLRRCLEETDRRAREAGIDFDPSKSPLFDLMQAFKRITESERDCESIVAHLLNLYTLMLMNIVIHVVGRADMPVHEKIGVVAIVARALSVSDAVKHSIMFVLPKVVDDLLAP